MASRGMQAVGLFGSGFAALRQGTARPLLRKCDRSWSLLLTAWMNPSDTSLAGPVTITTPAGAPDEPGTPVRHPRSGEEQQWLQRFQRWYEPVLVFLLALATRLPHLNHVPHKDELNHLLAARALLETGTLEMAPGASPYERAWGFTYLVAGVFRLVGENLVAGRVPALLAGAALAVVIFWWVRREAGRLGGWVAGLLMIFSPVAIMLSQWIRFYTIHALLFVAACLLVFQAMSSAPQTFRTRASMLAAAVICLLLALHLQVLTLVGAAALGLWVVLVGLPAAYRRVSSPGSRLWLTAGLSLLAVTLVAAVVLSGFLDHLRGLAGYADLWALERTDDTRYYHRLLLGQYPTLWTLFPLALLIAAASRWRAALLCATVFGAAFVVHSLAAWKAERYLFYALPLFFAAWGIAVGSATPWVMQRARMALRAATRKPLPARAEGVIIALILAGVALFAAFGNPASSYAVKVMTVGDAEWRGWGGYRGNPDWVAAGNAVAADLARADVVMGSYDVTALYALNRLDYLLRRVGSTEGDVPDFHIRSKSGVPIVSTPGALQLVMTCYRSGLIFIERTHHGADWSVTPELVHHLEEHAELIPLPEEWRLFVYRWSTSDPQEAAACEALSRNSRHP